MLMKTQSHTFSYKPKKARVSLRALCWRKQRCVWGSAGHHGCEKLLDLAAERTLIHTHTHTHVNKQGANTLKIIWEHQVPLFLKLSLFLYHPLHLLSLCASLGVEGLICVISCSNHRGVTRGLIDMRWDKPTSATNISVCPASKQHILLPHTLLHNHQRGNAHTSSAKLYLYIQPRWPYLPHQEKCMPHIKNKAVSRFLHDVDVTDTLLFVSHTEYIICQDSTGSSRSVGVSSCEESKLYYYWIIRVSPV